jgi:hypothetical protein
MSRRLRRLVCLVMLGTLAFWQANLVLAACAMDRGELGQMFAAGEKHDCCDEAMPACDDQQQPMTPNACVAHSTSDLQALAMPPALPAASTAVVLFIPRVESQTPLGSWPAVRPPAVPPRILLHSFLI